MSTYPSFRPYKSFKKMTKFKIIVHIWTITVQKLNFIPKQKYSSGKKPTNAHFMCLIYQGLFCTLYARVFFVPWIYASGIVRRRIFSRLLFILSQRVQLGIVFELVSRLMLGPVFLQFFWGKLLLCTDHQRQLCANFENLKTRLKAISQFWALSSLCANAFN